MMPEPMKLADLMDSIEKAVYDAQSKLHIQQEAEKALVEATKNYSESAAKVEKLREEFNSRLPIFTSQAVRQF
jgi:hypothetical protein